MRPEKDLPGLLDAWARVPDQVPGARLTIVGDGFDEGAQMANLREEAARLELGAALALPGASSDPRPGGTPPPTGSRNSIPTGAEAETGAGAEPRGFPDRGSVAEPKRPTVPGQATVLMADLGPGEPGHQRSEEHTS